MTTTPPRRTTPPPPIRSAHRVSFGAVHGSTHGHRTVLYGPGGVGKTSLVCKAEGKTAFVDADESLEKLRAQLVESGAEIPVTIPAHDWVSLRSALQADGYDGIANISLDTWSPIEKWLYDFILATIKKDGGGKAEGIEDYGFGKGYTYAFEQFGYLLGDLDRHVRAGRNVFIICHDDTAKVPNPEGMDFQRWEPRMLNTKQNSIRYRAKEWCDHCLFLSYDLTVEKQAGDKKGDKAGRAKGNGTRTLRTAELPYFLAKSRTTDANFDIDRDANPWPDIFKTTPK